MLDPSLTEQLCAYLKGDRALAETILAQILPALRRIAVSKLGEEFGKPSLSPTELINEVWVRNLHNGGWNVESRKHFYSIVGVAMRRVLVDLARRRLTRKRGDGRQAESISAETRELRFSQPSPEQIVSLGLLMDQLEEEQPTAARVVDLHHFAGFTFEEISDQLGLKPRQVRYLWNQGREWLGIRLRNPIL
jgi:RNA polymerase sigma factor (TIGR02999 family)